MDAVEMFRRANPDARSEPNMGAMVGFSASRQRAEAWVVDSKRGGKPLPVNNSFGPSSPELMAKLAEMGLGTAMASWDPERDGLRVMRVQRDLLHVHPVTGKPGPSVGGYCQLTTVSPAGVSTRILERWPIAQAA